MKRYDVVYPRNYQRNDGQQSTDWMRVGVAWENDRGRITMTLYTMPIGGLEKPGEARLVLQPADEPRRENRQRGPEVQQRRPQQGDRRPNDRFDGDPGPGYGDSPEDDKIPF